MIKINSLLFLAFILSTPITTLALENPLTKSRDLASDLDQFHLENRIISSSNQEIDYLVSIITNHYLKKQQISEFPLNLTLKQAHLIQAQFIQSLIPYYGEILGYKAGLTNEKIQTQFNTNQPILGSLLENMILPSGTTVPRKFGVIPMVEGDLMVRVKNEKINTARTPEEALKYIDAVIPFMELPDLIYDPNLKLNKEMLIAVNVGARFGIVGTPITIEPTQEWLQKLQQIQVIITDDSGQELARGDSQALLGDPLKVVLWIKDQLQSQGESLKKGDLLSLGSLTPLIPVQSQTGISARYIGLDPNSLIEISVSFQE